MAFVAEAALIALREGLEALLITGILLGLVTRLGRPDARKHVWAGFFAAVAASVALGWLVQRYLLAAFEERGGGEWFELIAALAAVVVLTYMVAWMWKHTRELMTTVRDEVQGLLTRGALMGVVFLTFASVIREGLEVVLFYGALATRATPLDLAWSGLVGLTASAVIVWAILRGAAKVDLQRFFGVTGILLVFVAAGLIVHSVSAMMGLGLVPPAPAIWDTSGVLPDDSAVGRVLHALVGYAATPTLLQGVLYFGYVFGLGGWYLWSLGAFTRRTPEGRRARVGPLAAALVALCVVLASVAVGAANPRGMVTGHAHEGDEHVEPLSLADDEKVGILLRSHGEPIHYNETTYQSFADFVEGLLRVLGMEQLLLVDQGTVLLDKSRPFDPCQAGRLDAQLMDAWTRSYAGPTLCVATPATGSPMGFLEGYHLAPGPGPGMGEPDVLEMAGLSAYADWLQMDGASPMHETKGRVLDAAQRMLGERYGDRVVVQRSYHVLPRVGPGESDAEAAEAFKAAGVTRIVDAYTTTVFSDVMNSCMMMPHMEHAFEEAGLDVPIAHAGMAGAQHEYAHAVAARVKELLAELPEDAPVAVFLTHHGQRPGAASPCGDKGPDAYQANAKVLYEATLAALAEDVTRPGVQYLQVYGQGAQARDDGVLSPLEALEVARAEGARHVIDLPYELTGDGFDNLVAQRRSWGFEPESAPHYDDAHETRVTIRGMDVRIASAAFGVEGRAEALVAAIEAAMAGDPRGQPHGH